MDDATDTVLSVRDWVVTVLGSIWSWVRRLVMAFVLMTTPIFAWWDWLSPYIQDAWSYLKIDPEVLIALSAVAKKAWPEMQTLLMKIWVALFSGDVILVITTLAALAVTGFFTFVQMKRVLDGRRLRRWYEREKAKVKQKLRKHQA